MDELASFKLTINDGVNLKKILKWYLPIISYLVSFIKNGCAHAKRNIKDKEVLRVGLSGIPTKKPVFPPVLN